MIGEGAWWHSVAMRRPNPCFALFVAPALALACWSSGNRNMTSGSTGVGTVTTCSDTTAKVPVEYRSDELIRNP